MSKLTILDKSAVIRNETQPLANTRGRVADALDDIANTLIDENDLDIEATARAQGDQDNADAIAAAIAAEATARAQGDDMKLDKPTSDGSYYIAKTTVAGIPYYQYRVINLSSGQIPVSRDSYIGASLLYESVSGRIGLDTPNPSEKFEVYNGRVKSDGFILTSSAVSPLPKEIKFKGGNFVGAKDDGIERKFLMGGDAISFPSNFKYAYGSGNNESNIAYGWHSLSNNTTGVNNCAIGNTSLYTNTSGSSNNAYGSGALALNSTGSYNCAYGNISLYNNTGSNNSAFGHSSLRSNTSGGFNCAFGVSALNNNSTANSNAAFGYSALSSNNTGSNNSAFGTYALTSNTSGNSNTGFGRQTLNNLNTGSDNTAVGDLAGTFRDGSNTVNQLSQCVYIGSQSRANANAMVNEIAIGYMSRGQGSNTATIGNDSTETLHLLKNGAGIVLKSPDGTKKVKISIDNSGNLITTLI